MIKVKMRHNTFFPTYSRFYLLLATTSLLMHDSYYETEDDFLSLNDEFAMWYVSMNDQNVKHITHELFCLGTQAHRTPRNLYVLNLAVSGILICLICIPPTLAQVYHRIFGSNRADRIPIRAGYLSRS